MNKLKTIRVERPNGKPVKLLSGVAEGMHPPYGYEPYIRKTNVALSTPYGSSGGIGSYGHDWYSMKLAEEKELANG